MMEILFGKKADPELLKGAGWDSQNCQCGENWIINPHGKILLLIFREPMFLSLRVHLYITFQPVNLYRIPRKDVLCWAGTPTFDPDLKTPSL